VPGGGYRAADPPADVPAVRGRVTDLGDPPLPAAGGGRGGAGRPAGAVGGAGGRPRVRRPGPPDQGLPRRDRPDTCRLRPGAGRPHITPAMLTRAPLLAAAISRFLTQS